MFKMINNSSIVKTPSTVENVRANKIIAWSPFRMKESIFGKKIIIWINDLSNSFKSQNFKNIAIAIFDVG